LWVLDKAGAAPGSFGVVTRAYSANGAASQLTIAASGATLDDGITWAVR
jgi:hypothetical protein